MMISDEQARLAASDAQSTPPPTPGASLSRVSDAVIQAAKDVVAQTPDTRPERVAEARHRLAAGEPAPSEVAEKIISRILADSLR